MICPQCSTLNPSEAKYCRHCGCRLTIDFGRTDKAYRNNQTMQSSNNSKTVIIRFIGAILITSIIVGVILAFIGYGLSTGIGAGIVGSACIKLIDKYMIR